MWAGEVWKFDQLSGVTILSRSVAYKIMFQLSATLEKQIDFEAY